MTFTAPDIAWAPLTPLLIVLGAAALGVLIESFVRVPAERRMYELQLSVAALLAALLAGEQLFASDYQDGTLSQDALHIPLWQLVAVKIAAAWLRFVLPLLLALPLIAIMLHLPFARLPLTAALLAIGSLALLLIAGIGAALTLGQTQATFLRYLIVIPLYLPVLIIGVTASADHFMGLPVHGHTALLAAFALFSLIGMIPFTALALRTQALP